MSPETNALWIVEQARVLRDDEEGPSVAEALNLRGWRGRSKRASE